jgi:hypothetical protein
MKKKRTFGDLEEGQYFFIISTKLTKKWPKFVRRIKITKIEKKPCLVNVCISACINKNSTSRMYIYKDRTNEVYKGVYYWFTTKAEAEQYLRENPDIIENI